MKQKNIPWLGAFLETFFTTLPFLSIVSFLAIIMVLYSEARPYLLQYAPWMTLWLFLVIIAVVGVFGMWLVYRFVLPSIWTFRGRQMFDRENQLVNKIESIESLLESIKRGASITAAISGGFDPLHKGHIRHIKAAMRLGNRLLVILSTDEILARKKGRAFMGYDERKEIIEAILGDQGEVVPNICEDGLNCIESLRRYRPDLFCKGGDSWNEKNLPEYAVCQELGIKVVFGVGGFEKLQSSSNLIAGVKNDHNNITANAR